jgi:ectoine hydroxylase-related dioxygenase (phytanoyl-CoA dioxygenase family)
MQRPELNDRNIEEEMQENGFILIKNFLSASEIEKLFNYYSKFHTEISTEQQMWNSLFDINNGKKISDELLSVLVPKLNLILKNGRVPVATFMSKNPNKNSVCDLHRDYSIIDEEQFEYRNFWIPLVDTNKENGSLYVIPKSHKLFNEILPMFSVWRHRPVLNELEKYIHDVEAKAGDLVIYADRLLHGSYMNRTEKTRPVIHFGVLPENAELFYYKENKNTMEVSVYNVAPDFYFNLNDIENFSDKPLKIITVSKESHTAESLHKLFL